MNQNHRSIRTTVLRGIFGENDEKFPPGNRAGQTDDYLGL